MERTEVILVDENDNETGTCEKMEAHKLGFLHRAFSIFIFDSRGRMLLQQRALEKYHSGGLWTNACCSHPQPGEEIADSARRRLREELGFETSIQKIFDFVYKAEFENGLVEHEFDHVFTGRYEEPILFNGDEVMSVEYKDLNEIEYEVANNPNIYTSWFKLAFPRIREWVKTQ